MYIGKRHYWILEMIKGADLAPAGGSLGRYSPKTRMTIVTAAGKRLSVGPADTLELSTPEVLKIEEAGGSLQVAWNEITQIEFETPTAGTTPVIKPSFATARQRLQPSHAGKKAG